MMTDNVITFAPGGKNTPGLEENRSRDQAVALMNERYAWLDDEHVIFDIRHFVTRKREQADLDTAHMFFVEGIDGRKKTVTAINAWLTSPDRRRYAGRKFLPGVKEQFTDCDWNGQPLGGTYVNLWRGWGCEPVEGSVRPFLELIARLCGCDETEARSLIQRLAAKIQKPWLKIPSYILIVTHAEGTGKSQFVSFITALYGKHGKIVTDREFESSFDDWKRDGVSMRGGGRNHIQGKTIGGEPSQGHSIDESRHYKPKRTTIIPSRKFL